MNQSTNFDYIAEANLTASNQYHGNLVPHEHFKEVLTECISALEKLDRIKKTLFYGRDLGLTNIDYDGQVFCNCNMLPIILESSDADEATSYTDAILIIHGIIGGATEKGELLEHLKDVLFTSTKKLDATNIIEEIGDGHWYDAIIAKALNVSFDDVQRTNIAKLRARFGEKFTEYDANNRNLTNERKVLEQDNKPLHNDEDLQRPLDEVYLK
jgi:hypothetical protein